MMNSSPLAFGLFTEELPVVFFVTRIENSEWVLKSRLFTLSPGL